jgi:hypothetical protein
MQLRDASQNKMERRDQLHPAAKFGLQEARLIEEVNK